MGTIKQGILGGFSGKVGTVVGSTWKSVHYMRALAVSFSDPRTEKQKNQRSKFTAAVNFTKAMTPFLRFGYKEFSGQQSAFNAAVSYILKHAMKGSGTNVSIDYNKALVTRGSLVPALDATVTVNEGKVTFAWTDNSGMGDATVTDAAMLLAYNKDKGMAVYDIAAATRSDAKAELKLPANWKDDALAIYLGFCNEDVTNVANSVCLQDTPISGGSEDDGSEGGGSGVGGLDGKGGGNRRQDRARQVQGPDLSPQYLIAEDQNDPGQGDGQGGHIVGVDIPQSHQADEIHHTAHDECNQGHPKQKAAIEVQAPYNVQKRQDNGPSADQRDQLTPVHQSKIFIEPLIPFIGIHDMTSL